MATRVAIGWSSGKDAAYTLYSLYAHPDLEPAALFTTYCSTTGRIPIQGTPIEVVREQARCIGLPLIEIDLPENCSNAEYEKRVLEGLSPSKKECQHLAFGDLFLEGIKDYRESFLIPAGFELVFPLLGASSLDLARMIVAAGFQAKVCSVDSTQLDRSFVGWEYDDQLLKSLPADIDPCGERGEFHTVVYDGPIFYTVPQLRFGLPQSHGRFSFLEMRIQGT
ncbi:MAG: hypothetical protein AB7G93_12750 [Bdellovibrionales bacterium]